MHSNVRPVAKHRPDGYTGSRETYEGGSMGTQTMVGVGMRAPGFTLPALGGGEVSLADYRGRKVAILMWASW